MTTPYDKSQEIINKIRSIVEQQPTSISYETTRQISIKSALICVDEILEYEKRHNSRVTIGGVGSESYWELIKEEIKKLT